MTRKNIMKSTQKRLFIKVKKIFIHGHLLKISVYLWLVINFVFKSTAEGNRHFYRSV